MSHFKKSKAQSCLPVARSGESSLDIHKYIIIDSENEDQVINMRQSDSCFNIDQTLTIEDKRSVILKSKGSTVINFLSNFSEPQKSFDRQIRLAEKQVKDLQKECELLQKLIGDMIEEQSSLVVQLRRQERAISISKNVKPTICIEQKLHSLSQMRRQSICYSQNEEMIKSKVQTVVLSNPLSLVTAPSNKIEENRRKSLQIIKKDNHNHKKLYKKGKENSESIHPVQKKKKSLSKSQAHGKHRNSICKTHSKAY